MRAMISLIFAPYWILFLLAGGLAVGGYYAQKHDVRMDALHIQLANQPQPELLPIEAFEQAADKPSLQEVNVRAQIVPSESILLQETDKNGKVTNKSVLYLFFAADAGGQKDGKPVPMVAYAGAVVPIAQKQLFENWATLRYFQNGAAGSVGTIVNIEGMRQRVLNAAEARNGMDKYKIKTSKDFFFVEPFYKGRAEGVAYTPKDLKAGSLSYFYPAFGFSAFGLLKLLWVLMRGKQPARKPENKAVAMPSALAQTVVAAPALQVPKAVVSNDFIGALGARKAATMAEQPPAIVSRRSLSERFSGGFGGGIGGVFKKAASGFAALVIYLVISNFSGSFGMPKVISLTGKDKPQVTTELAAPAVLVAKPALMQTAPDPATAQPMVVAAPVVDAPMLVVPELTTSQPTEPAMLAAPAVLQAKTTDWLQRARSKAQAPLHLGAIALPLWVFVTLSAGLALMAMTIASRLVGTIGAKRSEVDPFERLLKRRLAEKAREEQAMSRRGAALRA